MLRNRPPCAPCLSRSIAAKRTGRGRSPACAGAGSADAGGAAGRGDRRGARGTCQHGAQLAGLLRAWWSGGTAAAPETGTAGHDRAARWSDRGGDPERRCAPRRRLDAAAPVCRDRPARIDPEVPPVRPERHVANSIATIRRHLIVALATTLARCPCCNAPRKTNSAVSIL